MILLFFITKQDEIESAENNNDNKIALQPSVWIIIMCKYTKIV